MPAAPFVAWTLDLSHLIPEIQLSKVEIEKMEKSIYLLKAEITKSGFLPVSTAFARKNRLGKTTIARLKLNGATLLAGSVNADLPQLVADGQKETVEWQIFAPKPTSVTVEILSEKAGKISREIVLK